MRYNNSKAFEKHLQASQIKNLCSLYLLVCSEYEERSIIYKKVIETFTKAGYGLAKLNAENLKLGTLKSELESYNLLFEKNLIVIENINLLQKELQDYLIHSIDLKNLKNALFFTSEKISRESLLYKKIEKKAVICEIPPKKSWENEQNLAEIAVEFAQKMNKKLSLTDAQKLIKHLDLSSINLQQELEKVALYVGDKLSIDWTDILKICTLKAKTSIWEYSSALLEKNSLLALKKLKIMLLEEQPALQIVRQLVKIFANSFKLCEMYDRRSSTSEILIQFPHLKGNLLHKETAKAQKFGFNSFKSALNLLFKLEVSLKTSSQDQNLLFTLFTHKICNL